MNELTEYSQDALHLNTLSLLFFSFSPFFEKKEKNGWLGGFSPKEERNARVNLARPGFIPSAKEKGWFYSHP